MTRFVMLTDQPERLEREYGAFEGWSVVAHSSAVAALLWERRMRSSGACVLDSRGWRHGVTFTRMRRRDPDARDLRLAG